MWKLGPKKGGHKVSAAAAFTSFYTYWPRPLALPENTPLALLLSFFCFPNDLSALSFFTSLTMYLSWDFPTSLFPPFFTTLEFCFKVPFRFPGLIKISWRFPLEMQISFVKKKFVYLQWYFIKTTLNFEFDLDGVVKTGSCGFSMGRRWSAQNCSIFQCSLLFFMLLFF